MRIMSKLMKLMGFIALILGAKSEVVAQEMLQADDNQGFFKQAFRDMKESAKRQRKIDKANFKAQKMETKAFYEEQKALSNPNARKALQEEEYKKKLEEVEARLEAAKKRIHVAKGKR